jgi:CRP/FNR family transcriptional regulator
MLSKNQQTQLIAAYPVLRRLSPWLWQVVASEAKSVDLPAGGTAFDKESPCQAYLMVISGGVRVVKPVKNGRELLLYRVQPGDSCILTVSCLLGDCSYQARGIVEADLACVVVPRSVFLQLVEQSPEFRTYIFRFFGERLAAFRKLDQRLAQFLLDNGPALEVTHQSLANELGSVREVVSRILEDLHAQGIVGLDRGKIHILDEPALKKIAQPGNMQPVA